MNSKIYYFFGIGNLLVVLNILKEMLNGSKEVIFLVIYRKENNIDINEDILVIVFFVYFVDVFDIVKFFVEKLNFNINIYIYVIVICNGVVGYSLFIIDKLFKKRGKKLFVGFLINMFGNVLIIFLDVEEERLKN